MIEIRVVGIPAPGGSKRGFVNPRTGRVVIVEDAKRNKTWRESVAQAALAAYRGDALIGPVGVEVVFLMPRPKGHYGSGRNAGTLKRTAPCYHVTKPDATKLWRSTEDALTGLVWRDDAQVATQRVFKKYANKAPGAIIRIFPLPTLDDAPEAEQAEIFEEAQG